MLTSCHTINGQHQLYYAPSYWASIRLIGFIDTNRVVSFDGTARNTYFNSELNFPQPFLEPRFQFTASYQQQFSSKLYGLAIVSRFAERFQTLNIYRITGVHRGDILGFDFIKKISLEYWQTNYLQPKELFRIVAHAGIGKKFKKLPICINVFSALYRFSEEVQSVSPNRRRLDKTRLRIEFEYFLNAQTSILLFAMRETDYWHQVGLYDENGNLVSPDGNVNKIFPIYGMTMFFRFGKISSDVHINWIW